MKFGRRLTRITRIRIGIGLALSLVNPVRVYPRKSSANSQLHCPTTFASEAVRFALSVSLVILSISSNFPHFKIPEE